MSGIALGLEGGAEFGSDRTTNRCIRCSGYVQLNRRERDSTAHVAAEMGREEAIRSGARNTAKRALTPIRSSSAVDPTKSFIPNFTNPETGHSFR